MLRLLKRLPLFVICRRLALAACSSGSCTSIGRRACCHLVLWAGVLCSGLLDAQDPSLTMESSVTSIAACGGEEVTLTLSVDNPAAATVGGYQIFLKYPAELLEPVRFEATGLTSTAFVVASEPVNVVLPSDTVVSAGGFESCDPPLVDPWGDGLGEDVVAIIGSVSADGVPPPSATDGEIGRLVFRVAGSKFGEASFALSQDVCRTSIDQSSRLYSPSGARIGSAPLALTAPTIAVDGAAIESFDCTDLGSQVDLTWQLGDDEAMTNIRIRRDGVVLVDLGPTQTSFSDLEAPPVGTVLYELFTLGEGGAELCRASCRLAPLFVRGDADNDGARDGVPTVDLTDALLILNFLFEDETVVLDCQDAADANDNGSLVVSDAVGVLVFLFGGGPLAPPAPALDGTAEPGPDPTPDDPLRPCERPRVVIGG